MPTDSCSVGFSVRFPGIELPGRDVDQPLPTGTEVNNVWSYTPTSAPAVDPPS